MKNHNIKQTILEKKLLAVQLDTPRTEKQLSSDELPESINMAIQLDVALMKSRFKTTKKLFNYVTHLNPEDAITFSSELIKDVSKMLGNDKQHNTYFKEFPKNVPEDTIQFWIDTVGELFMFTGLVFEGSKYGNYQHTYEEMLEVHDKFEPKSGRPIRYIELGKTLQIEAHNLFVSLATSPIPLNENDRELFEWLITNDYALHEVDIPIRENKAIYNSIKVSKGEVPSFDTVVDGLRLACHLSGGDVTLTEKTRFKNFSRRERRLLLEGFDGVHSTKIVEALKYKEQLKRLASKLHPFSKEYNNARYKRAREVFSMAIQNLDGFQTWESRLEESFDCDDYRSAITQMKERAGVLVRNIGRIIRNGNQKDFEYLIEVIDEGVLDKVPTRVLLSAVQGLYPNDTNKRAFINKKGTTWITDDVNPLRRNYVRKFENKVYEILTKRNKKDWDILVDPLMKFVAVPLSEKNKSEGFNTLSRGSVINIDTKNYEIIRLFFFWKQTRQRTDYDLSVILYDRWGGFLKQCSWTHLSNTGLTHSGDLTNGAGKGSSEFIDIDISKLPKNVGFIVPQLYRYCGEAFNELKENFMGYMLLSETEKGKPFEPHAVETKFKLIGDNGIYQPFVFSAENGDNNYSIKWLDISSKGLTNCNLVEADSNRSSALTSVMVNKHYVTLDDYLHTFGQVRYGNDPKETNCSHYVGLNRPDELPEGVEFIGLTDLKELVK